MDLSFILNELGEERNHYYNAVSPPIFQTSNFAFPTVEALRMAMQKESKLHLYSRGNNPTVEIARRKLAALEHTEDALIFSSGVAAVAAVVMNSVAHGDHIICVRNTYSWTQYLLDVILQRYGVTTTYVDGRDIENFKNGIQPHTRLIFLESPNTFLFELQDLSAVSAFAKARNIRTVIDNSYCTPVYQKPYTMGVDVVIHTATKYLAGHSDVVLGAVCSTQTIIESIFKNEFMCLGAVPSPHDVWLLIRGLRTLELRLERSAQNAAILVEYLSQHSKVQQVIYPYHYSHPQYSLAKKQMIAGSGLFSVLLKTQDQKKVELFCNKLNRFLLAVSWGGYESLVFPACASVHSHYPVNLVRLYAGVEPTDVLLQDIEQALQLL